MSWFKVDDNLAFHPKVMAAGNSAMGGWIRLGTHCARYETDGFATEDIVNAIFAEPELKSILRTGMLVRHADGRYEMHDYLKYNPSHAQLEEKRKAWVERQANHRSTRESRSESLGVSRRDTRVTPGSGSGTLGSDPDPDRDPDGDSHRASAPRLKSAPPPPPEAPIAAETGYDLAKRVFAELWRTKYREPYAFDFADPRQDSENRVLQELGARAKEHGAAAENWIRYVIRHFLQDRGHKDFLLENKHPAKCIKTSFRKYMPPPKPVRAAPARASPPEPPPVSVTDQAARAQALAKGIGKIGMGGSR